MNGVGRGPEPPPSLLRLYVDRFGATAERVTPVAADGSARRYWRLGGEREGTVIGAFGPDPEENRAFLSFSRAFRSIELPVPEIYAADEERGVWLEEDLGDTTLFDRLSGLRSGPRSGEEGPPVGSSRVDAPGGSAGDRSAGDVPPAVVAVYRRVLEILPRFQVEGARVVNFRHAYPRGAFDRQSIHWDLNYFKYHFLKLARIPFHEARLERDFGRLSRFLRKADARYFLYRDFQSRNVMLRGDDPWFIDYQGGRKGALPYDPASLLYDAKADLPETLREELLEHYLDALADHERVDRAAFLERYPGFVLVRLLQALGAYGYRGFFERKPHFLQSVPYAARTLSRLVENGLPLKVPELEAALRRIAEAWAERDPQDWPTWPELADVGRGYGGVPGARTISSGEAPGGRRPALTVRVVSFSYRRGYPQDPAGHGGFVFDCRSIPNPGREEAYRHSSGQDPEVAAFLETLPETQAFWERIAGLVEVQVRSFLERGLPDLTIGFGCTGGQHRSVYFAERLARHLREAFPEIRVEVMHRERPAWPGE